MTEDFDAYTISTDKTRLDLDMIQEFLNHASYWAQDRPLAITQAAIENSLCFGVYKEEQQVGFARVVTDYATFAWLCDVFVLDAYRGQGIGKRLIEHIVSCPELQGIKILCLATRDAHGLYRQYGGFEKLEGSIHWMVRSNKPQPVSDER
ncbi:MAG: GNAT family N-acetyltransferase [Anaerolineae bacterium]|nr:GNAT family N-acetyltransferase [Anaerolineae bacterium]